MICERCNNEKSLIAFGDVSLCAECWTELGARWKAQDERNKRWARLDKEQGITEEDRRATLETNLMMIEIDKFVGRY